MNVLILGFRDANPFFDEIEKESSTHFTYGTIQDFNTNYDAILIHWPEKIFNRKEPSIRDLDTFTTFLKTRKQENCPIVHCFHNERRHYGMTSNFETLYKLVWTYADVFIHFGSYSKMKYEKMYPEKVHEVIPHPLYLNSFSKISKTIGRKHLEISEKSKVIYIAGKLRKKAERDFILKAFDKLDVEDKLFLGHILLKNKFPIDLSARIGLRKLLSPIKKVYEYCANFDLRKKLASEDDLFEFVVDNGSEDLESNDEEYIIYCDQSALHILNEKIISQYGQTTSAELIWKSDSTIEVEKDIAEKLFKLLNSLEDNEDVQGVSSNFEVSDEILKTLTL